MKKTNFRFSLGVLAIALAYGMSAAAHAEERKAMFAVGESQIKALGIQTAPVQKQAESIKIGFPAQVLIPPRAEQVLSSPVAGVVVQMLVQLNQAVRAGEPLLRFASPEFGQLQLQLLQANARATLARQAATREQSLFDEGIIAKRRVQEAQAALMDAEATLNQARSGLRLSGVAEATIARIIATGQPQDSIALTATQSGIVTEISAKLGQRVEAATELAHIAKIDTLWLDIQVPASESENWPRGTKITVQGHDLSARILSTSPLISATSQTVALRAEIQGKNKSVRPGEFVTVEMPAATMPDSWDVPLVAVVHEGDQAIVFVRTPEGFEARPVKIVARAGQRTRVQGSVKAGDQIAVAGLVALKGAWLNPKESE